MAHRRLCLIGFGVLAATTLAPASVAADQCDTGPLDLTIVLDTSTSLWSATNPPSTTTWELCVSAVEKIFGSLTLSNKATRVAVISFDDDATLLTPEGYVGDANEAATHLGNFVYAPGPPTASARKTHWHLAFEAVQDVQSKPVFGNRGDKAAQVVLFVTDGFPSAEVNASIKLARSIRDAGSTIVTVQVEQALGIAAGIILEPLLVDIASGTDVQLEAATYAAMDAGTFQGEVQQVICSLAPGPAPTTTVVPTTEARREPEATTTTEEEATVPPAPTAATAVLKGESSSTAASTAAAADPERDADTGDADTNSGADTGADTDSGADTGTDTSGADATDATAGEGKIVIMSAVVSGPGGKGKGSGPGKGHKGGTGTGKGKSNKGGKGDGGGKKSGKGKGKGKGEGGAAAFFKDVGEAEEAGDLAEGKADAEAEAEAEGKASNGKSQKSHKSKGKEDGKGKGHTKSPKDAHGKSKGHAKSSKKHRAQLAAAAEQPAAGMSTLQQWHSSARNLFTAASRDLTSMMVGVGAVGFLLAMVAAGARQRRVGRYGGMAAADDFDEYAMIPESSERVVSSWTRTDSAASSETSQLIPDDIDMLDGYQIPM